jgi:hypothetical protein
MDQQWKSSHVKALRHSTLGRIKLRGERRHRILIRQSEPCQIRKPRNTINVLTSGMIWNLHLQFPFHILFSIRFSCVPSTNILARLFVNVLHSNKQAASKLHPAQPKVILSTSIWRTHILALRWRFWRTFQLQSRRDCQILKLSPRRTNMAGMVRKETLAPHYNCW